MLNHIARNKKPRSKNICIFFLLILLYLKTFYIVHLKDILILLIFKKHFFKKKKHLLLPCRLWQILHDDDILSPPCPIYTQPPLYPI